MVSSDRRLAVGESIECEGGTVGLQNKSAILDELAEGIVFWKHLKLEINITLIFCNLFQFSTLHRSKARRPPS